METELTVLMNEIRETKETSKTEYGDKIWTICNKDIENDSNVLIFLR